MKNRALLILCVLLVLPSVLWAADRVVQVDRPQNLPSFLGYVPDEFVVVLKPGAGPLQVRHSADNIAMTGHADLDLLADRFQVSRLRAQFPGAALKARAKARGLDAYYKVRFKKGKLDEAMAAYAKNPLVDHVEPIGIHAVYATPNDTYFDPYQTYHYQANDHDIDTPEAWDIQTGNSSIIVALLDSGTRYYHPDLGGANASPSNPGASRGNMWINSAELNGTAGVDDDGNGYVDDWIGYDFIDGVSNCWAGEDCDDKDNDPRDFNGHGTHTAGIMGMITNDGYGMAGVAGGWANGSQPVTANGIRIMPLRMGYSYNYFGQEYGVVIMDAAAEAFYYAADNGARIASCSWGSSNSGGLGAAVDYFLNAGGLIFVAAGNDGDESADYLNDRGDCISVAAVDANDAAASFTTYGTWVDICAPGVDIYSTYHDHTDPNTNYWASMSGTSMATPMAAAVGALIWSQNPTWTASQVEDQLYSSAENIDAYLASKYIGKMGAGRINAYNAVNTGPPPAPTADFVGSPTSGTAPLTVNFTDQSTGSIDSWSWDFGDGGSSTAQNPSHTYSAAGTYTVSLTVTGPGGSDTNTKTDYITVNACIAPTAAFSGSPTSGDAPLTVSFTDESTGSPTSWSWDFGDGGTSTAQNPSHTYSAAGTYTVTLTATNSCGSDDAVRTDYITVNACVAPTAAFSGSPTSGNAPLTVSFTDESTGSPTSWSWDFGDGGTSTAQNPSHTYSAAGTYTVTLTATNSCGSDQAVRTDYITVTEPSGQWYVITYDDFEGGFGNYTDGGADCSLYTGGTYAHQGSNAADIQDNSGVASSFYHTVGYNVSGYTDLEVEFWYEPVSMDRTGEDFWVQYYDGSTWQTVAVFDKGVDFENKNFYHEVVSIPKSTYNYPTNAKLRFMCDASGNVDDVYIDEIEFRGFGSGGGPTPPAAPSGLTATAVSSSQIDLAWTDNADDEDGFHVERSLDGTSFTEIASVGANVTSYSDGSLSPSTTYTYRVRAYNSAGNSDYSNTASATTEAPGGDTWVVITYDDFEGGFGHYTDGGGDCSLYTGGTYAHQGTNAADIQDNSGVASSFYHTVGYDVSGYVDLEVEFWYEPVSMDRTGEDFWVQYYDGSTWQTVAVFDKGVDFENNNFYHEVISIPKGTYNYPTNAKLRFMCDASGNKDDVYIDEIEFRGLTASSSIGGVNPLSAGQDIGAARSLLSQNHPNPFRSSTMIQFSLADESPVKIVVFDIKGRRITTLADRVFGKGVHSVNWDARGVPAGVYFYRIQAKNGTETKRMLLLR